MRAEEVAKTLIDIQCRIYERHGATGAPTDREEYERWVCEAEDAVTQLYGSVDMSRHGLEMGKAWQMATDMGAHIAAEALERALEPECDDEDGEDDPVAAYDAVCDEMSDLAYERAIAAREVAREMRRLVGIEWSVFQEKCEDEWETVSKVFDGKHPNGCMLQSRDRLLVVYGYPEFDVPTAEQFMWVDGQPPEYRIVHAVSADDDGCVYDRVILLRRGDGKENAIATCASELITQPDYVVRQLLMEAPE